MTETGSLKGLLPLGMSLTVWFVGRRRVSAGHTLHVLKPNKFGLPVKSRRGRRESWLVVSSKLADTAEFHVIGHQQPLEPALGEVRHPKAGQVVDTAQAGFLHRTSPLGCDAGEGV